jgi:hypothetical protein
MIDFLDFLCPWVHVWLLATKKSIVKPWAHWESHLQWVTKSWVCSVDSTKLLYQKRGYWIFDTINHWGRWQNSSCMYLFANLALEKLALLCFKSISLSAFDRGFSRLNLRRSFFPSCRHLFIRCLFCPGDGIFFIFSWLEKDFDVIKSELAWHFICIIYEIYMLLKS